MVDADLTYDFGEIPRFVSELEDGAQLVWATACSDIKPGAMPFLSRIGNPLLSGFLNVLHRTNIHDAHCGMRAIAARRPAGPEPPHRRHGVRLRDGDPRDA